MTSRHLTLVVGFLTGTTLATVSAAQVLNSEDDLYGFGLPYPLVHLMHSADPNLKGTTAHLKTEDPFLLYTLGRDLIRRQFGFEHGTFGQTGDASVPLYAAGGADSPVPRFARDHTNSCGGCHSIPHPEPGAGQTIASTGGAGRNTPHFYGAGLVEMLGEDIRARLLRRYDRNRNGWIDRDEVASPSPANITTGADGTTVNYGDLAPDAFGVPQLNSVFRLWFLNAAGGVLPEATSLSDSEVAGFDFVMQPFGWGRGDRVLDNGRRISQGGEASTVRQFFVGASDLHLGLEAFDPSLVAPNDQRIAGYSLSGALQVDFGDVVDRNRAKPNARISRDDPDGDGHFNELTEGDVDAAEFYMLNLPPPSVLPLPDYSKGRALFVDTGCSSCHVPDWQLSPGDPNYGYKGDRRFFELRFAADASEITASLVRQDPRSLNNGPLITGVYSDFRNWDIGPKFHEVRYDGSVQTSHRTAPLWGVGSTAPYGHSGQFLTLHSAIMAHGGAADGARTAYATLAIDDQQAIEAFLRSLVLYVSDELPTDLNGDGQVSDSFEVGGHPVGYERFDPRFLTRIPPVFRHVAEVLDHNGRRVPLQLLTNAEELYGLNLPFRVDADGDSFPDLLQDQDSALEARQ